MKRTHFFIAILLICSAASSTADTVHVKTSWDINITDQKYRNNDTKVSLGRAIAGFRLKEANPARDDGSAKFIYYGEKGFITLYHEIGGVIGASDPAAYVLATSSAMEGGNGKFDSRVFFALRYKSGARSASGRGVVYHFLRSPEIYQKQVWDEFGSIQIGPFFFSYRGSFLEKSGLDDLHSFLRAIGIRKA